ncbi:hypothetical protein K470DRAFT_266047 [Piedraia hortae CBS 480.64]|uniref:N1221-domain-containing protein n=1 Tax=Piedraia hortae CBS 480.64 TaxID=1314780 RepID=A0A6A7BTC1_9PEZI|nr:hypothetical protein K470DRAFT_266047 [Piedraia hortae CBS 480.64]
MDEIDNSASDVQPEAPDSLTLADLKQIRNAFPTSQPFVYRHKLADDEKVYDFEYSDAQSLPVELDEWFESTKSEEASLQCCMEAFDKKWRSSNSDWLEATEDERRTFIKEQLNSLEKDPLMVLNYIALGVWDETAGRAEGCALEDMFTQGNKPGAGLDQYWDSALQLQWIVAMVHAIHACDGLNVIYEKLQKVFVNFEASSIQPPEGQKELDSIQLWCLMNLMYLFFEVARTTEGTRGGALKQAVLELQPKPIYYFTELVSRIRWDDYIEVSQKKMFLLAWKAILLTLGGIEETEQVRSTLRKADGFDGVKGKLITASPLDYHQFRQEIISKYPAYDPPKPIFPLEPENNSILPPLTHRQPPPPVSTTALPNTHSIMHEPVHIATPAPSPPPSPAGPGKAGKKQNYQTNQMLPFLFPPLDEDSNKLGGRGSTLLQDELVRGKWSGGVVPKSIQEAAELFSSRSRATRSLKQLWTAREEFMQFERGWVTDSEPSWKGEESIQKLKTFDDFYRHSLPYLQSLVIVWLRAVLHSVTDDSANSGNQAGLSMSEPTGLNDPVQSMENGPSEHTTFETAEENIEHLRRQEISSKALSGSLFLLIKWFKLSHVLQFEHLCQLLLDSNYVPLALKVLQTPDVSRAIHVKLDKQEWQFFHICRLNSRQALPQSSFASIEGKSQSFPSTDEGDAVPPPIMKEPEDSMPAADNGHDESQPPPYDPTHPPEIDELGYLATALPSEPIRSYSWRNAFSSINYLRILQKVTRNKAHRALMLVTYRSSLHLRRALRVPIPMLRYYTLKVYKTQVPFCGRKWRSNHMKIITEIWNNVPTSLRDDWLSGGGGGMGGSGLGDVDGTVEDALLLEQSMRSLTHWWNLRNYPVAMGVEDGEGVKALWEREMDFFARELAKLDMAKEAEAMMEGEQAPEGPDPGEGGAIEGY